METTLNKILTGKEMLDIFDNDTNCHIRNFKATRQAELEKTTNYEIVIRHNEDVSPEKLFLTLKNK